MLLSRPRPLPMLVVFAMYPFTVPLNLAHAPVLLTRLGVLSLQTFSQSAILRRGCDYSEQHGSVSSLDPAQSRPWRLECTKPASSLRWLPGRLFGVRISAFGQTALFFASSATLRYFLCPLALPTVRGIVARRCRISPTPAPQVRVCRKRQGPDLVEVLMVCGT